MHEKREVKTVEEADRILSWWQNDLTPEDIFGLEKFDLELSRRLAIIFSHRISCPYDQTAVSTAYKSLRRAYHPDKYPNIKPDDKIINDKMKQVFQLLEHAKDYLLYKINSDDTSIASANNLFYDYYHAGMHPGNTPESRFQNVVTKIYDLRKQHSDIDISSQIEALKNLITDNPRLIHHMNTDRYLSSWDTSNKKIAYCAVQWEEADFLKWLLDNYPTEIDLLAKTSFDMSAIDIALKNCHLKVFEVLKNYFGEAWLIEQLYQYIRVDARSTNAAAQLALYQRIMPTRIDIFKPDPLLLPALIEMGIVADPDGFKLKQAIIGCPEMYLKLNEEMRQDPYMIVAFLAQQAQPDRDGLYSIPLKKLDPGFATALADHWPILEWDVSRVLREAKSPLTATYDMFYYSCIALLVAVILALLVWQFWPIIVLWPEPILEVIVIVLSGVVPAYLVPVMFVGNYATKTYPEARKINTLLAENNFFKPAAPLEGSDIEASEPRP